MATIVITSYGTLGDSLPYIALGQALKARGHRVRMSISEPMHPYAQKVGLEAVPVGRLTLGPPEVRQAAKLWNHWSGTEYQDREVRYQALMDLLVQSIPCVLEACQDADLLISAIQQDMIAAIVSEKIAVPWVRTCVMPIIFCQEKILHTLHPNGDELGKQCVQEVRLQQGLPETPQNGWQHYWDLNRMIMPASSHFCQMSPEYSQVHQTGFWFYEDPDWSNWQPTEDLRQFVEREPKPLVFTTSSVPVENPQEVVEVHVRAAALLGRRILIQQGWADFNESQLPLDIDRDMVMFTGFMPQDWLFARAAALIYHGGVGTTARSLRNGCPILVEPYGNDQFFNARMVLSLGVGAAMHPERLTAESIARVLEKKVLTEEYKQRAEDIGVKIRAEQGIMAACNLIESGL